MYICKTKLSDNFTIPLLSKRNALCNIIQKNNFPLQVLDY